MSARLPNELGIIRSLLPGSYGRLIVCLVLGLAGVGLLVVLPQQVARLTNLFSGDQSPSWGAVHAAVFYLVASQLGLSIISYWHSKLGVEVREALIRNLTLTLFTRVLRFSADFFRDREAERIKTRALDDAERVATLWAEALIAIPYSVVSIVVFAVLMLVDNWFLGACMIPLSLLSGYFLFFDSRLQALNARDRDTREAIRAKAHEAIVAVAELRQHFAFDYGLASLRKSFQDYRELMYSIGKVGAWIQALAPLVATVQLGVLTWVGAALCMGRPSPFAFAGRLTWGDVIGFMLLLQLFQRPVNDVTGFVLRWRMTRESIRRVEEFLERPRTFEPSGREPALMPGPVDLEFGQVDVRASSGAPILSGIEMQIPRGAHVALVGPAGCGKSTAIQLVMREYVPSEGRVELNARAVADYHGESVARTVGFVPQKPILLNNSIRNNVLLGLRRRSGRTLEDAEGPIDISRLESVQDAADLNRELLRAVRLVDLEADVLRKFLDNRLPETQDPSPLRASLVRLRKAVADRFGEAADAALVPFDEGRYLPGRLADNLVGVGLDRESLSAIAARVLESLEGEPLLQQLLEFGRAQMLSDHALWVHSVQQATDLQEFLPSRPTALEKAGAVADRKSVPLEMLPKSLRLILLEVALDGESLTAQKAFGKDFAERVVVARRLMEERNPGWAGIWKPVEPGEYLAALSVRENLLRGRVDLQLLGAAERVDRAIQEVLETEGLLDDALLTGLEFVVGEEGKYLSGGQRQKVALARALLKNPSLLLLDEATASLDELSQARITEMVREHFADRTVVAISHRLSTIRHYDQIVVLDHGQVVQRGTFEELATQEGIFRKLVLEEQGTGPHTAGTADAPRATKPRTGQVAGLRRELALCALFAHFKSKSLALVERLAKEVRCAQGYVLFREGDPANQFFLVLEGEVEIFLERGSGESQRREVIATYGPGGYFGEVALFAGGRRTLSAVARTDLHLGILERDDLLRLIAADPQIAISLLRTIATREAAKNPLVVPQTKKV